jgi:hypothetical protein
MPDKKRTGRLDWEDVRYFVALARNGTLSATARGLRVNHTTVARRIASLETLLGRALFDRRANGYALAAEGRAVFNEASAMDQAALSVLRRIDVGTELSGLGAWRGSRSAFTLRQLIATSSRPGKRQPLSDSTKAATSLPKPRGSPASSAACGFHFAPIAKPRRLPRLARAMALRSFRDTSWRRMNRTS